MSTPLFELIRNAECHDCGLHRTAQAVCLIGDGRWPADIMLVGEAPGYREDSIRKPFAGKAGRLLDSILENVELKRSEIFISNAVHCRPPDNRSPNAEEIETCRQYLKKEIAHVKPKLIVALGNIALRGLLGKRAPNVTNARGATYSLGSATVIGTYHPAAALRTPYFRELIEDDIRVAIKLLRRPSVIKSRPHFKYTLVTSKNFTEVTKEIKEHKTIALDIESTGLDMYDPDIKMLSFAIATGPGKAFFFPIKHHASTLSMDEVQSFLQDILEQKRIIGHNVKFDMRWLNTQFKLEPGKGLRDTLVMFHLLDENYPDRTLKHLARVYTKIGRQLGEWDEKVGKVKGAILDTVPLDRLMNYNCGDTDATYRLYKKFIKWINEEKLTTLLQFQGEVTQMLLRVELNGFKISQSERKKLRSRYEEDIESLTTRLRKPYRPDLNLNSPKQLIEILYKKLKLPILEKTPTGQPSAKEDVLIRLSEDPQIPPAVKPWITQLLQYRTASKLYTSYLVGLDVKEDGCVHANYRQAGTVTGRLSCSDPNLQQIPREGPIKNMFVSSFTGGSIVQADYNQVELRVLAHYTRDPGLLEAFDSGRDIHRAVAARVFSLPERKITEEQRKFTKQVNFGIAYCISPHGLAAKLHVPEWRAEQLMSSWFREFGQVKPWIRDIRQKAMKYHMVWTPFGRRRRFATTDPGTKEGKEALRQAVNFPIQSLASDITVFSMLEFWKEVLERQHLEARIVANVHDSIVVDCPRKEVKKVVKKLREICEHPRLSWRFGFELQCPLKVDIKTGPNWGNLTTWGT